MRNDINVNGDLRTNEFVDSIIRLVQKHYGVNVSSNYRDYIRESIYSSVIDQRDNLPTEYNIRYNGKIVKGKLGNIDIDDLISMRERHKKSEFTTEDWENCLKYFSNQLVYCEENSTIYKGIDKNIIEYLNKHQCSSLIYKILINEVELPDICGETAKIYDTFIKKERDISLKKDILLNDSFNKDYIFVALRYVESVHTDRVTAKKYLTDDFKNLIKKSARDNYIIEQDVTYRVQQGLSLSEAINIGIEESKKYGFKYKRIGESNNFNFIQYFRWLANQELGVQK